MRPVRWVEVGRECGSLTTVEAIDEGDRHSAALRLAGTKCLRTLAEFDAWAAAVRAAVAQAIGDLPSTASMTAALCANSRLLHGMPMVEAPAGTSAPCTSLPPMQWKDQGETTETVEESIQAVGAEYDAVLRRLAADEAKEPKP
jgi:hypothetical protein